MPSTPLASLLANMIAFRDTKLRREIIQKSTTLMLCSILVSRFIKRVVVNPAGINADYVRNVLSIRLNNVLTLSPVILVIVKPR